MQGRIWNVIGIKDYKYVTGIQKYSEYYDIALVLVYERMKDKLYFN